MTNSEILNALVTEMAAKKGYAYTTGFLQSMVMELSYDLRTAKMMDQFRKDLQYSLDRVTKENA